MISNYFSLNPKKSLSQKPEIATDGMTGAFSLCTENCMGIRKVFNESGFQNGELCFK